MNPQLPVVVDEAELAKFVHKKTYPGAGGSDHLGQRLLRDIRNYVVRLPLLAEIGQQKKIRANRFSLELKS